MAEGISRRRFLKGLGSLIFAGVGGYSYARWAEPHWLEVDRVSVPLPGLTQPVRVLHLSDLHASRFVSLEFIDRAITLGLAERPDVVVLTGDFITRRFADFSGYSSILRRLSAQAPAFACAGNHDGGTWARNAGGYSNLVGLARLLGGADIRYLHNETEEVRVAGQRFQLLGLGDWWSGECVPASAFRTVAPRSRGPRIVLNHNPDAKDLLLNYDWDLMLCGHTHGGQLRLPFIGTPFAPVRDKRYVEGLHHWRSRWLYITRGVGNLHGLRFNCRPQVSVIDLVA